MTEILILILFIVIIFGVYLLIGLKKCRLKREMADVIYLCCLLLLFRYYDGPLWSYCVFLGLCAILLAVRLFHKRGKKLIHWTVFDFTVCALSFGIYETLSKFSGLSRLWCFAIIAVGAIVIGCVLAYFVYKRLKSRYE